MALDMEKITMKFKDDKIEKLSEKEIDYFIDEHWLEWTMKYDLSPIGDLTVTGKREYIENNLDEIKSLIEEFPECL